MFLLLILFIVGEIWSIKPVFSLDLQFSQNKNAYGMNAGLSWEGELASFHLLWIGWVEVKFLIDTLLC